MTQFKWQEAIESRATRLGATVDWGYADQSLNLDAPTGRLWRCDGIHTLVAFWYDAEDRRESLRDLWDRTAYGLEYCEVEDCEMCGTATTPTDPSP